MRRMGTGLAIRGGAVALMATITATAATSAPTGGRQMERLDRALVVVPLSTGQGMHVSWRLLATDPANTRFTLLRDGKPLRTIAASDATSLVDPEGSAESRYSLRDARGRPLADAAPWTGGYLSIPLDPPADRTTPDGERYSYSANDASVGDLDGDGRAEIAMKTADGTIDGAGKALGDAAAEWRETVGERPQADRTGATLLPDGRRVARLQGRILRGPEYLTIFDGRTGRALASQPYAPTRGPGGDDPTPEAMVQSWGDAYGNRSERYLASVAYLDGRRPSLVFARGYYGRSVLAAWD